MPDVPQQPPTPGQQEGAPNNAVSEALGRQIGPLKAWQWGLLVGGAYLLYRYLTTGSLFSTGTSDGGSTAAFVPVSTGDGAGGATTVPDPLPTPTPTIVKQLYVRVAGKTAIRDKTGKVIHWISKATYKVGPRIKVNGRWLYPIIGRTGWYISPGGVGGTTTFFEQTVTTASTGLTTMVMAPVTTSSSNPSQKASTPSALTASEIDQATQIASRTIPVSTTR